MRKLSKSRSRSRSKGRNNQDDLDSYQSNPKVQKLVQDLVSKQVAAELADIKRQLKNKGNTERTLTEKLHSPSESTLYVPAIPRVKGVNPQVYESPINSWLNNSQDIYRNDYRPEDMRSVFRGNQGIEEQQDDQTSLSNTVNNMLTNFRLDASQRRSTTPMEAQPSTSRPQPHEMGGRTWTICCRGGYSSG